MHMFFHNAWKTNASTRTHILHIIVSGVVIVSLQCGSEYIELAACVKHNDVKKTIKADYNCASETSKNYLYDEEYLEYGRFFRGKREESFGRKISCHCVAAPHNYYWRQYVSWNKERLIYFIRNFIRNIQKYLIFYLMPIILITLSKICWTSCSFQHNWS